MTQASGVPEVRGMDSWGSTERVRWTAFHEAGHIIASKAVDMAPATTVTIVPAGAIRGQCRWDPVPDLDSFNWDLSCPNRERAEALVISNLGGLVAEARHREIRLVLRPGTRDMDNVEEIVSRITASDEEAVAYRRWLLERTINVFADEMWWASTSALAHALLERSTMTGSEAVEIATAAARRAASERIRP
jgi:hypothetical protein